MGQRVLRLRQEPPGQDAPVPLDRLRVPGRGQGHAGWPSCRPNIKDLLNELSTQAKRQGGLHAAAGTLGAGAGDSVRLELLGIIFKSVGLPEQLRPCLRSSSGSATKGWRTAVRQHVADGGRRLREGTDQPVRLRR